MGNDDEPIRGEVRIRGFRRVSHGLFLAERDGLAEEAEFLRDLVAWRLVLPDDAVFTHLTAARLLGWRLPALPSSIPVFAAVHGIDRRPRRPGLICSRLVDSGDREPPLHVGGLPVDDPEEILLRAARDLGHLDLVVLVDSALSSGQLEPKQMAVVLSSRRPGTRALAAAYHASDSRSESPGETLLRLFHCVMDVDVTPQVDLHDPAGGRHRPGRSPRGAAPVTCTSTTGPVTARSASTAPISVGSGRSRRLATCGAASPSTTC